jgi:hypothetical protein
MRVEIRAFFDQYCEAFNRLDGEAIARLYCVPSGIATDTGYMHWSTFEQIRKNMVALCQFYEENGFVTATFEPRVFLPQGEDFAIADISWSIGRTEGRRPSCFNTTYNLMRTEQGWRVLLCTAYSEETVHANKEA